MSDSYGANQKGRNFDGPRDNRGREPGGFRIRLSDNEMRAVRSIQETFNLRSTVAVLGFAIRTFAQMLEEGKLDSLVREYRSQSQQPNSNKNNSEQNGRRNEKPNPFARPSRPGSDSISPTESTEEKLSIESQAELTQISVPENQEEQKTANK